MESCCAVAGGGPDPRRCPECGVEGRRVGLITLKALLRPSALPRLSTGDYQFCASPTCPVVYFGGGITFRTEDVGVPVFQKEHDGHRTVCYCFDVSEGQIQREAEPGGTSESAERIKALVREDRCACEVRNPQGSCCLGNVSAALKSAKALAAR